MADLVPYGVVTPPLKDRSLPVRVVYYGGASAVGWAIAGGFVGLLLRNGVKGAKYGAALGGTLGVLSAIGTYQPDLVHMAGIPGLGPTQAQTYAVAAAKAQITAALSGTWINTVRDLDAAEVAAMSTAPTEVTVAYLRGAYWLGVAARIAQSRTLALKAGQYLAYGAGEAAIPGGTVKDPSAVRTTILQAAEQVRVYQRDTTPTQYAGLAAVFALLQRMADTTQITQQQRDEQTWGAWAWEHKGKLALGTLTLAGAGGGYAYWRRRKRK